MPYKIFKRNGKSCVFTVDGQGRPKGETHGCHDSHAQAVQQMRALYVHANPAEGKAAKEIDTKEYVYVPFGVVSFAELDKVLAAQDVAENVRELTQEFMDLTRNIMDAPALDDKASAVNALATEFTTRLDKATKGEQEKALRQLKERTQKGVLQRVKDWLGLEDEPTRNDFLIWKEASGRYRWLASFSNRYRDQDNPPEILADAAHRDFVKATDEKSWPMPELQHWHIPGAKWGTGDWMAYDGAFILASGTVDKGYESDAEHLMLAKGIKVSHGMPRDEIRRDDGDPTIITRYRSIEISDLPDWAAANALTGFEIIGPQDGRKEVSIMAIPDEKKKYLKETVGWTDEQIARIEAALADKEKAADAAGLETKDTPAPAPEATPLAEPGPARPTADEVAQAIAAAVKPILEQMTAQAESVKGLAEQVKALKEDEDKKLEAKAAATPGASLRDLVARAIGDNATKVAADDPLATKGPKQTDPTTEPITGIPFIDAQIRRSSAGLQKPQ